ncbi:MAG: hypothetical protein KIS94_11325 [Chitinophagales bacterium]|nr:hypothetical protein [Chitinophagales bacterium]
MKRTIIQSIFIATVIFSAFYSCKPKCERHPDDPECLGESELITTLRITFTDSATGAAAGVFQYRDADGNGLPEVFDTILLSANKTYKAELQFLNESVTPAQDVTDEIEAEKNEHFISFSIHTVSVIVTYIDFDTNNPPLPVGLQTYWRTGAAGTGHVRVKLKHQPGTKDGTANPGDTDADVEFAVVLQ